MTEAELERLRQALKILSDAEKQLRHSSERSTWFTAALLQLGAGHNLESTQSSNNTRRSTRGTDDVVSDMVCDSRICKNRFHSLLTIQESVHFYMLDTKVPHNI